ncbi:MAG: hypothetical protein LBJ00_13495 [Planctomycetaceae bacterium]|jgi:Mg-chelatase subunit ChlD|nr:hypothetical protein [Planctomycetaceae bacterium]
MKMPNSVQKIPRYPIKVPRKITVPVNQKKHNNKTAYFCVIAVVVFLLLLLLLFLSCTSRPVDQVIKHDPKGLPASGGAETMGTGGDFGTDSGSSPVETDAVENQTDEQSIEQGNGKDLETSSPHELKADKNNTENIESDSDNPAKISHQSETNDLSTEPDKIIEGEKLTGQPNKLPDTGIGKFSLEQHDATVNVFGINGKGSSFVFVFDRSGSMIGRPLHNAKLELVQALDSLNQRHHFNIIFYDDGKIALQKYMIAADKKNKKKAMLFIEGIGAGGGTKPLLPLLDAISYRPDVIFFLTDGVFSLDLDDVCRKTGKTKINVIQFGSGEAKSTLLQELAERTKGDYRYIDIEQLDKL